MLYRISYLSNNELNFKIENSETNMDYENYENLNFNYINSTVPKSMLKRMNVSVECPFRHTNLPIIGQGIMPLLCLTV